VILLIRPGLLQEQNLFMLHQHLQTGTSSPETKAKLSVPRWTKDNKNLYACCDITEVTLRDRTCSTPDQPENLVEIGGCLALARHRARHRDRQTATRAIKAEALESN